MRQKSIPVVSIILYVLAALLFGYSIWALVYSSGIVSDAVAMGQLVVKGSEFEVISFYMQNIALYFLFGVVMFALGWILQSLPTNSVKTAEYEDDFSLDEDDFSLEEDVEDLDEE